MLLLAGMLFISGCASETPANETDAGEEERVTTVEGATPSVTEEAAEPAGNDSGEGLIPGQEEDSPIGGEEGIIPGEEEPGQDNETAADVPIVQAAEDAGYTTFASVVRDAGLEGALNEGGPYTVFAPTNEAFDNLPEGAIEELEADKEKLTSVLNYHVVNGEYKAADVVELTSLNSLGGTLFINTENDKVMVGNATVTQTDILANNGVVHGIDQVLIPQGLEI